jgi:outer membrane lipoprotein-sorting protein
MQKTIKKNLMIKLFLLMFAVILIVGSSGCTSKKKLAVQQAAAERLEMIEKAKQDLLRVINDQGSMSISDKENLVSEVKGMNLEDPEVDELIVKAEKLIAGQRREEQRIKEEQLRQEQEINEQEGKYEKIEAYFDAVANNKSMEMAQKPINEALKFFASPDVPVLIIIHTEGSIKDYDRPTTIKKYLEYLKDQGKNMNEIYNVVFDKNGKITEIELIKK